MSPVSFIPYVLIGILSIVAIIQHLKLRHVVKALNSNNKALNETRELVATHHKNIKKLLSVSK